MAEFRRPAAQAIILMLLLISSCALPRDPAKTSQLIAANHELRVGFTDNPPWTNGSGAEPTGIEPQIVREFAEQNHARVAWSRGSETTLVQSLKRNELDLVIGGFDKKTQWSSTAGVTQPFAEDATGKKHVMLAAPGENRFILSLDRFLTTHSTKARGEA